MTATVKEYSLDQQYKIYVTFYGEEEKRLIMSYSDKDIANKCIKALLKKKKFVSHCWVE